MDQVATQRNEEIIEPMIHYYNNTSSINISKNSVMHTKTKHIAIKYHYLRELVQDKGVDSIYIQKGTT